MTILVVDDELDILLPLAEILQRHLPAVTIIPATSAAEAMQFMRVSWPDLVIADFRMPGMNGIDLLARLHQSGRAPHRILMTAFPTTGLTLRAVNEAGVAAIFTKPFDGVQMALKATQLLSSKLATAEGFQ